MQPYQHLRRLTAFNKELIEAGFSINKTKDFDQKEEYTYWPT